MFASRARCPVSWIVQRPWQYSPDGGLACFDVNTMVVDGAVWLSQLFEHRVHKLVEKLQDSRGQ